MLKNKKKGVKLTYQAEFAASGEATAAAEGRAFVFRKKS